MKPLRQRSRHALRIFAIAAVVLAFNAAGCKRAASPENDDALTQAVQTKLTGDASLVSEPIQASVEQGVATLNGSVDSDTARSLAANDAAQVSGIRTVVNNLTVKPRAAASSSHKLNRREKPLPGIQSAQAAPPPTSPQDDVQPAAPVERSAPPAAVGTPPILPPGAFRAITLITDTTLPIRIGTTLDSATTKPGDSFTGSIDSDIIEDGLVVLAQGTPVSGRVDTVQEAAHFKGSSLLTISLTSIDRKGDTLTLTTDEFSKAGNGRGKNTAAKVGGGAAIGAILGGILGGGKGAAIGAGVGGGAGAGVQAATKGQQVQIPAETLVRFHLSSPLVVRVSTADKAPTENHGYTGLQNHEQ